MFWVALVSPFCQASFVLVWKRSPQRVTGGVAQKQVTTGVHIDVGCFHPINIHQRRAKANMFPLCDFTIDETRKTSPGCLSCSTHRDGNGTPKQIMVRKQRNHLQAKTRFDMTVQRRFLVLRCRATCHVFMINPFLAPFSGLSHFFFFFKSQLEPPSLFPLDYNWLCLSINLPQQNTTTWFNMDMLTKPEHISFLYLPVTALSLTALRDCCYAASWEWILDIKWNSIVIQNWLIIICIIWYCSPGFEQWWKCCAIHLNGTCDYEKLRRGYRYYWGNKQNKMNIYLSSVLHIF